MSKAEIIVRGMASGQEVKRIRPSESDMDKTMMELLNQAGLPIASSCGGEGICSLCTICNDVLSCQVTVATFIKNTCDDESMDTTSHQVTIDYL